MWLALTALIVLTACNNLDDDDIKPVDPPVEQNGNGTLESPYSIAQAIKKQGETAKWVEGYIIGAINTTDSENFVWEYEAPFGTASNLLIAATPDERDQKNILVVQLPVGAIRDALNLVANSSTVLGQKVKLLGDLTSYFSKPGLKNVTSYEVDGVVPTETIVSFTSNPVTSVETGAAYSYSIVVNVTNPQGATTITASGVPAWATFTNTGDGTATITGTAPATVESSAITLTATNNGVVKEQTFTLNVTKPVAPGVNLIANGNFEDWTGETPASWSFKAVTGVTYEKNTTTVHNSTNSVKVVSSATSGTASMSANRIKLTPGNYVYTFYYNIDPAVTVANTFRAWGMIYDDETATSQSSDPAFADMKKALQPSGYVDASVKGEWAKNEIAFTVPKDCYIVFDVRFYKGTTGFIDSVSLVQQ